MKGRFFSWQALILAYITFIAAILILSGCATHHSVRIGDTTYRAGVTLEAYEHD